MMIRVRGSLDGIKGRDTHIVTNLDLVELSEVHLLHKVERVLHVALCVERERERGKMRREREGGGITHQSYSLNCQA